VKRKPRPGGAPAPLDEATLERAALSYLERFDTTAKNLARVLRARIRRETLEPERAAALERSVDALLTRYRGSRLLDDERFAEHAADGLRRRGAGRRLIEQRLADKGVTPDVIAGVLHRERAEHPDVERVAALRFVERRLRARPEALDARTRARLLAALGRQGYDYDVAREALERCAKRSQGDG
jgi:regulatory protein